MRFHFLSNKILCIVNCCRSSFGIGFDVGGKIQPLLYGIIMAENWLKKSYDLKSILQLLVRYGSDAFDDNNLRATVITVKNIFNEIWVSSSAKKGPIIYFIDGNSPSRHKWNCKEKI